MAISTIDNLIESLGNNSSRIIVDKASVSNTAAGQFHSLWRATGQPGQGAIPTTPAVCSNALVGSMQFTQQVAPATSYLGILEGLCSTAGTTFEVHDRLMHMGGLVGNIATAQTVDLDLHTNLATNNLADRIGDANYSDVQWWLEWYTNTGSTSVSIIANVTYNDGTTGNLTTTGLLGTSRRATFMFPLNNQIPAADSGKYIREVNTVQLNATSGTAGNFGVTVTRYRAALYQPIANVRWTADWAALGLPEIRNESCLFPVLIATGTSTGVVRVTGKIAHG